MTLQRLKVLSKVLPLVSDSFGWSVAESYRIQKRPLFGQEVRAVVPDAATWARDCRPGREERLVEDLAAVSHEKALLAFAARYGLLGYSRMHGDQMRQRKEHWTGDPVTWALAHARIVRGLLSTIGFIEYVRSGRFRLDDSSAPRVGEVLAAEFKKAGIRGPVKEGDAEESWFDYITPEGGERKVWVQGWERDPIGGAYVLLTELINPIIRGVHYEFVPRGQNAAAQLGTRLRWNALLEVIYWQLAESLGGEFRQCQQCRRVFPASGRRVHCSPSCTNKWKCKEYRDRKKQKKARRRRK